MRVLGLSHVFPRRATDPSAPFLLTWSRALHEAGADVGFVVPHDAGLPARQEVAGVPVRLVRYAPDRWERIAYRGEMHQLVRSASGPPLLACLLASLAASLRAQARIGRPDLCHVHWWVPGAIVARLAALDLPVVCTVHGTDVALLEARPGLAVLARWALAGVDRIEAVSGDLAERLEAATGRRADAVNPMPLETSAFVHDGAVGGGSDGPVEVLAVGRMVAEKGFAELLAAAARLETSVRVTIIGDGPERERIVARAGELGVDLSLPGRVSPEELRATYRDADVVVQASHREGLGLVAVEALAAGVPVVATDSGGARDVLDELVPAGDVDGLARQLAAVASDLEGARRQAAVRAEQLRERFSPAVAAERTLAGYREVREG